jgi:hypothetical protein
LCFIFRATLAKLEESIIFSLRTLTKLNVSQFISLDDIIDQVESRDVQCLFFIDSQSILLQGIEPLSIESISPRNGIFIMISSPEGVVNSKPVNNNSIFTHAFLDVLETTNKPFPEAAIDIRKEVAYVAEKQGVKQKASFNFGIMRDAIIRGIGKSVQDVK